MTLIVFKYIAIVLVSYFLGNFTFARYVSSSRKKDVLANGSGNPGTMNMLRNYGFIAAFMTLFMDAAKCIVPCVAAYWVMCPAVHPQLANLAIFVAGISCVLGHIYPVTYNFKGGKGVASGFGFAIVANWWLALASFGVFVIVFVITRIAAISTLTACVAFLIANSVILLTKGYYVSVILQLLLLALLLFAHRANLKRIFSKKEKKIDLKASAEKDKEYIKSLSDKKKDKTKTVVDDNPPEMKETETEIVEEKPTDESK